VKKAGLHCGACCGLAGWGEDGLVVWALALEDLVERNRVAATLPITSSRKPGTGSSDAIPMDWSRLAMAAVNREAAGLVGFCA